MRKSTTVGAADRDVWRAPSLGGAPHPGPSAHSSGTAAASSAGTPPPGDASGRKNVSVKTPAPSELALAPPSVASASVRRLSPAAASEAMAYESTRSAPDADRHAT